MTDYFPEVPEHKYMIREPVSGLTVKLRDDKGKEGAARIHLKNNSSLVVITLSGLKPTKGFDQQFTSIKKAEEFLRSWIDNPENKVTLVGVDREYAVRGRNMQ